MAGGGPMMDFGCHRIEVLLNLFGRRSRGGRRDGEHRVRSAGRGHGRGPAAVRWRSVRGVAVTHASPERQDTLHVFGTRGAIHVDDLNAGTLRIRTDAERVEHHPPASNVHRPLIDDFVEAVLGSPRAGGHRRNRAGRGRHRGHHLCCRAVSSLRRSAPPAARSSPNG